MKPLIKWAGGKSNEIKYVEKIIPQFDRYIEPFLGGAALFFNLEPKKAVINDISKELILFYKLLKNAKRRANFRQEIFMYVEYWERIPEYMNVFGDDFLKLYRKFGDHRLKESEFIQRTKELFTNKIVPFNGLFKEAFCISRKNLLKNIEDSVIAKLKRTKYEVDPGNNFSDLEIKMNIESAFKSGFYFHFRDVMNRAKKNQLKLNVEKKIANYYFIREFCYGGMFRFNSSGDFNVPYGGIAYNNKDFRKKVEHLFSNEVISILKRVSITNKDFEELLNGLNLKENDFIFLDPPYDTEFSEYEENPFTRRDQERLAKTLINITAKWILIIKETDFIRKLYENKKGINIFTFDKEYRFNIRARNKRGAKHLIVNNLEISQDKQIMLIG